MYRHVRGVRERSARNLITSLKYYGYHRITHLYRYTIKNYDLNYSRISSNVTKYLLALRARTQVRSRSHFRENSSQVSLHQSFFTLEHQQPTGTVQAIDMEEQQPIQQEDIRWVVILSTTSVTNDLLSLYVVFEREAREPLFHTSLTHSTHSCHLHISTHSCHLHIALTRVTYITQVALPTHNNPTRILRNT